MIADIAQNEADACRPANFDRLPSHPKFVSGENITIDRFTPKTGAEGHAIAVASRTRDDILPLFSCIKVEICSPQLAARNKLYI